MRCILAAVFGSRTVTVMNTQLHLMELKEQWERKVNQQFLQQFLQQEVDSVTEEAQYRLKRAWGRLPGEDDIVSRA
jgi:hypothetical protein